LFVFNTNFNNYDLGKQIITNNKKLHGHDNTQERKVRIVMENDMCTKVEMGFLILV